MTIIKGKGIPRKQKLPPVVIIVPGASQTPAHYATLMHHLHLRGYGTLTALLPSVGAMTPTSAEDDMKYIRERMLLPVLNREQRDVILVLHSYAGCPGGAAAKGLGVAERRRQGHSTAVLGQIYIATILPPGGDGGEVLDMLGGEWPEPLVVRPEIDWIKCEEPREPMYADVDPVLAEAAARSSLASSMRSFTSPCPPASWKEPSYRNRLAYVRTMKDLIVPDEIQTALIESTGVPWIVKDMQTGHSPQLAAAEELAGILVDLTRDFVRMDAEDDSKAQQGAQPYAIRSKL